MSERNPEFEVAFRNFCAAQINLALVQCRIANGDWVGVAQAMGNIEGASGFLVRVMGSEKASAFFYRLADGIAAPMPQTMEK